ncbi:MAG: hypothetical protein HFI19_13600 [Lachnospiraceae bacterium]|nr:hypothetical protein [Lachnospiraceae bacterium]
MTPVFWITTDRVWIYRFNIFGTKCPKAGAVLFSVPPQKYVFIPIGIFKKTQHNKNITGKLNAWLMFFSGEEPEESMGLFSKELWELDRNTVQLMQEWQFAKMGWGKAVDLANEAKLLGLNIIVEEIEITELVHKEKTAID